jgi:methionine synthase II (cobalamin-independent)
VGPPNIYGVHVAWPWARATATGLGSLPGTDIVEAGKLVFGELPALPHLPELPERGAGADMIGRGAGLLVSLPVELYAGRWRVGAHAGADLRRARDLLERDLDALSEAARGYAGPLKIQGPGPWTLAAELDLPVGGRLLHDHGAVADLVASLADGLRVHVADVARRVEGATVLLQLDEPSVPSVLAGRIPTESGLRTLRRVAGSTVETAWRDIVAAVGAPVVLHCCAADPPLRLMRDAGAVAVSIDVTILGDRTSALDELGELLDAGVGLFAGVVPSTGTRASGVAAADAVGGLWRRLGFPQERAAEQIVVTPTCGLAGATPGYARAALAACVKAARRLDS